MSIESYADWQALRRVGRIVRLTLDALERTCVRGAFSSALKVARASRLVSDYWPCRGS